MTASTRVAAAIASMFVAVVAATTFATGAYAENPEPVPAPTSGQVSDQTPVAGGMITLSADGFYSNEPVSIDAVASVESVQAAMAAARAESAATHLGDAVADASGHMTKAVAIPAGFSGALGINMTGGVSGRVVSVVVNVAPASDNLAVTGSNMLSYVASGLVLLVGGAGLVVLGRRRRITGLV